MDLDLVPSGISPVSLALYAATAACAVALAAIWILTNRARRNAGFASKSQLKRHMSAKAVLRATEIRPSLTGGKGRPVRTSAVSLAKDRATGA
ncbi:hypothetical protein AB0O07_30325 [Streptomyces sp. NPDC093085]|uniref:hypothetical protein n=1 Tax=Streptomyces sp. NPDC093085 TaxID=3155068 RepID=UPI003435699C